MKELSKAEVFLEKTGLTKGQLTELLFLDLSEAEVKNGQATQLYINKDNNSESYIALKDNELKNVSVKDHKTAAPLSWQNLDTLNRFIRLSNITGLSFADLNAILTIIGDKGL